MAQDRVRFRAFLQHKLILDVWTAKGSIGERVEREVLQMRLNRGDFTHVDVIEPGYIHLPGKILEVMRKEERDER